MGWCSATVIFDVVAEHILSDAPIDKKAILLLIANILEDGDWDCQQDSVYYEHPLVQEIMKELHPHWFEEDDD